MKPALRVAAWVVCAACAVYVGGHRSAVPPSVLAPVDQLGRFDPFPPQPVLNPLLLDPVLQFIPWLEVSRRELRAGRVPTWNPSQGLGSVHLGNDQSAVFSLWSLPYYGLGAYGLFLAGLGKHVLLCLGVFLFLRAQRLDSRAALLGGIAAAGAAPVVAWQAHPHTGAFAYAGVMLLLTERVARGRLVSLAGLGLAVTTCLTVFAGHAQSAAQVALACALWLVVCAGRAAREEGGVEAWLALARVGLAVCLGLALAGIHWLPFAEALSTSEALGEHQGSAASLRVPARLASLVLFPDLFGSPRDAVALTAFGGAGYLEQVGPYAGASTLALAVLGIAAGSLRGTRGRATLALSFGALGLVCALVVYGPLSDLAASVPPFSFMRNHRLTLLLSLCVAVLGAAGVDHLLRDGVRVRPLGGVGACLLAAALVALTQTPEWSAGPGGRWGRSWWLAILVPTAAGLAALAVFALRERPRWQHLSRGKVGGALAAILVAELLVFGSEFVPGFPAEQFYPSQPGLEPARGARILTVGPSVLTPNVGAFYGLREVRSYDALGNRSLRPLLDRLAPFEGPLQGVRGYFDDQVADDLAVRFVLTDDPAVAKNLLRGLSDWHGGQPAGGPLLKIPPEGAGQTFAQQPAFGAVALPQVRCQTPTRLTLEVDGRARQTVELAAGSHEALFVFEEAFEAAAPHQLRLRSEPPWAEVVYSETDRLASGARTLGERAASGDLTFLLAQRVSKPYTERVEWSFERTSAWLLENPDARSRAWLASGAGTCTLRDVEPGEIEVTVDATEPATLVVTDAATPGWWAWVDGMPVAALRDLSDEGLPGVLAVDVPPGEHEVSFRYRSRAYRGGRALSGWGLGGLLVLLVGVARRRLYSPIAT